MEDQQTIKFTMKALEKGGGSMLRSGLSIERLVTGVGLMFNRIVTEYRQNLKYLSLGSDWAV